MTNELDGAEADAPTPDLQPKRRPRWVWWARVAAVVAALLIVGALLVLAMMPVGWMRGVAEQQLSERLETEVKVGAVTRDRLFSFTPVLTIRDVTIAQPDWAGKGDLIRLRSASTRVSMFALLTGAFTPDQVRIDGLDLALVRTPEGRANWEPRRKRTRDGRRGEGPLAALTDLTIAGSSLSLDDRKRGLKVAGPLSVDARGLHYAGAGQFLGSAANLELTGGPVVGIDPAADYSVRLSLDSPALTLSGDAVMQGVLNLRHFKAKVRTTAPTLKNIDRVIEAGLFGTPPVDLSADIRHDGHDWLIDRIDGSIGRSRLAGKGAVLKRDGRTRIDADIHASQFDFDDLADEAGRARGRALSARVGERVIPNTRINLSKIGSTDGRLTFRIDRILSRTDTVFRSLRGTLTLDHRKVTVSDVVAGMVSGRMTGSVTVDHRSGAPKLSTDLRIEGTKLSQLIGKTELVSGDVTGRIRLSGSGDTVRAALSHANGKAAIVVDDGAMQATVAAVLGQDLGKTIGNVISGGDKQLPLRCMIAHFSAANGVLTPDPLAVDIGTTVARGSGRIVLDGETVALSLSGNTRHDSGLRIVDPIRVGGTLTRPGISVAGLPKSGRKPNFGDAVKVVGKSLGAALGLGKKMKEAARPKVAATPLDCTGLTRAALR